MAWEAYAAWAAWHDDVMGYHLAQVNIARMRAPLDSPRHAPGDWMCPA
jgi:hypothetical protein